MRLDDGVFVTFELSYLQYSKPGFGRAFFISGFSTVIATKSKPVPEIQTAPFNAFR